MQLACFALSVAAADEPVLRAVELFRWDSLVA